MSSENSQPERFPFRALQEYCASQAIDQQFCQWPELRMELVNGQFVMGGSLAGSRWLLKEALIGWGLDAAIAFAPLDLWWSALRQAYGVSYESPEDWLVWAESLPMTTLYREDDQLPLGSKYTGEHRWVRDYFRQALSTALGQSGWGRCFGPNYGMQLGENMLTPDIFVLSASQMEKDIVRDCYSTVPGHLVVEVTYPEQDLIDRQTRRSLYEQAQVQHYWIIDPAKQEIAFWRWSEQGYQPATLDPDGCYGGLSEISFSPDVFWISVNESLSPYTQQLPAFTSERQSQQWEFRREIDTPELSFGSLPFTPCVGLESQPISVEQFVSWCPETKLEGPPFSLIGGELGTRNAIAMLMMSIGMVETVRLMPGYEWVRTLRCLSREQKSDDGKKAYWRSQAQMVARQLADKHGVGGVGLIGGLLQSQPLNCWSRVRLVLWDVPTSFNKWKFLQSLPPEIPFDLLDAAHALPSDWQAISELMEVLVGDEQPTAMFPRERSVFRWRDP